MTIWKKNYQLSDFKGMEKNNIHEALGIELTAITGETISGKMPVDDRTKQPAGILHGGASVVLAESLGSIASNLVIDTDTYLAVGQSVNAHHLRPATEGFVHGTAKAVHIGKKTQVWDIEVVNDAGKKVCACRLTTAVIPKPQF